MRALIARGYSVTGIDRRQGTPAGTRVLQADVAEPTGALSAILEDADAVWHLAACPGVRAHGRGVGQQRNRDNIEAGRVVLAHTPLETPLVVTSSSSVYGGALHSGTLRASRETDELRPLGGYALSKVSLERLCSLRRARGGWVAARTLLGIEPNTDIRAVIARQIRSAAPHQRPALGEVV